MHKTLEELEYSIKCARRYGGTTITVSISDLETLIEHSRELTKCRTIREDLNETVHPTR